MNIRAILLPGLLALCLAAGAQTINREHRQHAAELVSQLTLDEKISLLGGAADGFHTIAVPRLGIPEIRMADGPQGVRNDTRSTLFPCGVAAAASWNPELVHEMDIALGQDARARGVHMLLGPGVNIARSPLCGRNFEYFGEDPFLAAETAVAYITGVQSQGVMASVKHFALNNQEYNRHHINSVADERTMNEIYFPAFRAAVERAQVGSVMTSYNLVNGVHSGENPYLIGHMLRDQWHFQGFTLSDWTSTYTPVNVVQDGVDLEMPRGFCMNGDVLRPLLDKGIITEAQIDAKVQRILQSFIAFGFLDRPQLDASIPQDNPYSREVAYRLACEGSVLLKNNGILPLRKRQKVALVGPYANMVSCGGGSGSVDPLHTVSLEEGLLQDGLSLKEEAPIEIIALGFDKKTEKEDHDRSFTLPQGQEELVESALTKGHRVILVVFAGGAVDLSRLEGRVSAILWAWYPGQEGGQALADILCGKVSPSGRLPVSFPRHLEENPSQAFYSPSEPYTKRGHSVVPSTYGEGVFVGYRGYGDTRPLYPFGHGLSYTSFEYGPLQAVPAGDGFDVSLQVRNTGKRAAAETVQLYVSEDHPVLPRPAHELKAFKKVLIPAKESITVTLHLPREAFACYNVTSHSFQVHPGTFTIQAGASSEDIRQSLQVDVRDLRRTDALLAALHNPGSRYVMVVSHRGDWRDFPENSIPAIESAIRMGVDMIELDLKMTRDSVLVLMHDTTVDRTTTGHGRVSDFTLDSLKTLTMKSAHGVKRPGVQVPTLREALLACKDRALVNVDQGDAWYDQVLEMAVELGVTHQLLIKGKQPLAQVKETRARHSDNLLYMPIIDILKPRGRALFDQYREAGEVPLAYELCFDKLTPEVSACMEEILSSGSKLWINTLWASLNGGYDDTAARLSEDEDRVYGPLLEMGASMLQTDRPEALIRYLEEKGRRSF